MLQKFNTKLISENDFILVGLSGGADSVSLFLNLLELKETLNLSISAVHINHCLRGEESDNDEKFCIELCEKNGVILSNNPLGTSVPVIKFKSPQLQNFSYYENGIRVIDSDDVKELIVVPQTKKGTPRFD